MLEVKIVGNGIQVLNVAVDVLKEESGRRAMAAALNTVGEGAIPKVLRTLSREVGVPPDTVRKRGAIRGIKAWSGNLEYLIRSDGGFMYLKDFGPIQRKHGVRARPWGKSRLFEGAFINNGLHGLVMHKTGIRKKTKAGNYAGQMRDVIENMFGPAIPKEMVKTAVQTVFFGEVERRLPIYVRRNLMAATKGVFG
jgi:hypothetical protein